MKIIRCLIIYFISNLILQAFCRVILKPFGAHISNMFFVNEVPIVPTTPKTSQEWLAFLRLKFLANACLWVAPGAKLIAPRAHFRRDGHRFSLIRANAQCKNSSQVLFFRG